MAGLTLMMLCMACSGDPKPLTDEEAASQQAQQCYEALYGNQAEAFLKGRVNVDQMPEGFRQELLETYRHHARQVEQAHQGVRSVEIVRAQADSTLQLMQVFLALSYGDGTKEQIVVPMVKSGEEWRMK